MDIFNRHPNSGSNYVTHIEDSIYVATDTGIDDIIITDDFNLNIKQEHLQSINLRSFIIHSVIP